MAQAQVVQATCPGCKTVLRIPADWLHKPIRCKNCGTTMQARSPATAPLITAKPPVLPTKAPPLPAPSYKAPPVMPPAHPGPAPSSAGFDFDGDECAFDSPTAPPPSRRRTKKKGGKAWVGVAILGGLVLTLGTLALVFKDKLRAGIQTAVTGQLPDDEEPGSSPKPGSPGSGNKGPSKAIPANAQFPRRAMIISVHNYLYANPINDAPEVKGVKNEDPNIEWLVRSLNLNLRIPLTQIVRLSDNAPKGPLPPLRKVIEEGLVNFLKTCRKQDRIMVFFVGHTKEVNDKAYLVPLEGEFDNVETLIPLEWVYAQLAKCEARQKILVLDGNRFNAAQGEERPSAGPLGEKFQKELKSPPAGVQVWSACSAGQQSQEFEGASLGAFLDSIRLALTPGKGKGALEGKIQKHDDEIPVQVLFEKANAIMAEQVGKRKLKQVALLAGSAPDSDVEFDPAEKPAALPAMPVVNTGDIRLVREIMADISLPPLKGGEGNGTDVLFTQLPPFPVAALEAFKGGALPEDSKVRKAVTNARVMLWAISTATVPGDIKAEVDAVRKKLKVDLNVMQTRQNNPGVGNDGPLKTRVKGDATAIAKIIYHLVRQLDNLNEEEVKAELMEATTPKRWQANHEFLVARLNAQLAYLEEYSGLLGQMLKALPEPNDDTVAGWKMASKQKAGDAAGKKYDKAARAQFAKIIAKYPNTPWAVLSKRENLTALGMDWQAFFN